MKKLLIIAGALAIVACSTERKKGVTSWKTDKVSVMNGTDSIVMSYPVAEGGAVADSINSTIDEVLQSGFTGDDGVTKSGRTLKQAIDSLLAEKNADTMLMHIPYQAQSEGSHYEKDGIISVYLQAYYYMGGAHGMTLGRYLNFDAKTGEQLSVNEMFTNVAALTDMNRNGFAKFLDTKGSRQDYENYLFVQPAEVPLPQNIGLDKDGVVMLYNQYEIAAYVFGQSRYVIPYSEVGDNLKKY